MTVYVNAAVEGAVDEAVLRRLAPADVVVNGVFGLSGKPHLLKRLDGYNSAAAHTPWVVLIDLDNDAACAVTYAQACLPAPAPMMKLRVVVREVEAWLLADRDAFSRFLRVSARLLPGDPETLGDPKETVVSLARRSSSREIREALVPRPGSGRSVGPGFPGRMIEFAGLHWRPEEAATRSDSLARAMKRLAEIAAA